ncbi:MAG: MFS transporter [Marinilabiliales bacterium]|nr:MAG: MFS transporter [Marinilabiliales bacterium]
MSSEKRVNIFPRTFWIANTLELFERWAYYGMFTVLSVYLTDPISKGGLGFSQSERGIMQGVVTALLYLLPILGGALADKYGYKKVLLSAFLTLSSGYYAMGYFSTYAAVFVSFLLVAIGGALFKPIIVATVSKTTNEKNDTVGFGIFYMIVNIGGFIGPWAASKLREIDWVYVFIMCTVVILFNIILLWFYKEPQRVEEKKESLSKSLKRIMTNTAIVLKDGRFVLFLLIMVGMWTMYMQLFFTVPVYITQWIDTTQLYNSLPAFLQPVFGKIENDIGIISPELMINIPALTIITFQLIMSNFLKKVTPIMSMIFGILVIAFGFSFMSFSMAGVTILVGAVILAFGEMASSPRIQEYIGRIAPRDKVALYMGYSFLPVAGGNLIGGLLSGSLYATLSDKYLFLTKYLSDKDIHFSSEISKDNGLLFKAAMDKLGMTHEELNSLLFNQYNPGTIWYVFAAIGALTSILLFIYNRKTIR